MIDGHNLCRGRCKETMVRCGELVQKPSTLAEEQRGLSACTYSVPLPFTGV